MKVFVVFGTRPEAIKMCPLFLELIKHKEIDKIVCLTGQHRELVSQVMSIFKLEEDYNLDIMKEKQTLTSITISILDKLENVLRQERPDIVLVHGDTTTSYAAALAAFYQKIPVGHVEAGLRTGNKYSPFPEEMNRVMTSRIAEYHFAPTQNNKCNLEKENIFNHIYVTGNTIIDSFRTTVRGNYVFENEELQRIDFINKKVIVLTAHRRENIGQPLNDICKAIRQVVEENEEIEVVYPVHPNPAVREIVNTVLNDCFRVHLLSPIDVLDMHNLIARSYFVVTDSGGLQEEAPALGKPVLVVRTETERPEAVEAGTVKVVGVERNDIYQAATELLSNYSEYQRMSLAVSPYGDGHASERIVKILLEHNK